MKQIVTFLLVFLCSAVSAQTKYWVSFTDKKLSEFSLNKPQGFMSENALARRQKFNIPINTSDLPVCKSYLSTISNFGAQVKKSSKWLNGAELIIADESIVLKIETLAFVKELKKLSSEVSPDFKKKFQDEKTSSLKSTAAFDYDRATSQIEMLEGNYLHNLNFTGSNIDIAVMDDGFPSVDTNRFYQEAFLDGRIKTGYNFVADNDSVFISSNGSHGNSVISTMVSKIDGEFVGTAPGATYFLFCTEDGANEGLQEEYNWALAAEMADDLLGPNAIISTSLGYSNGFSNAADNHVYADMDGNTTPITIAADMAAAKGFLVINSAGNEGDKNWRHITAPSDGDSVLCIGAVKIDGSIAVFSSKGPAADGGLKPNVVAQGSPAYTVSTAESVLPSNGTSFSCPIISGMAACLWQAYPDKTNMEIFYAIEQSAHLYTNPDFDFGFGIPNFKLAFDLLEDKFETNFLITPNPVIGDLKFNVPERFKDKEIEMSISNALGQLVLEKKITATTKTEIVRFKHELALGTYYILLVSGNEKIRSKFVKN